MRRSAGMTLMEMVVGMALGSIVLLGAIFFAHRQVRALGLSRDGLETTFTGRTIVDLLTADLMNAGVGVGYREDGTFAGLDVGSPTAPYGAFVPTDFNNEFAGTYDIAGDDIPTDDIIIRSADGRQSTIAIWTSTKPSLCRWSSDDNDVLDVGDFLVFHSADGISARTASIIAVSADDNCAPCVYGCNNITGLTYIDVAAGGYLSSDPGATTENYQGGFASRGYRTIIWFVEAGADGIGHLRRFADAQASACPGRGASCGDIVADYVESVQMRVYEINSAGALVDRTDGPALDIDQASRIRVDFEIALRARSQEPLLAGAHTHPPAVLRLVNDNGTDFCIPGGAACNERGYVQRSVVRATVELKNSGRMRFIGGA